MNNFQMEFMSLLNNPNDTRDQINNFAKTVQGDPKARVEELINSGKMSQAQYNMCSRVAGILMKNM